MNINLQNSINNQKHLDIHPNWWKGKSTYELIEGLAGKVIKWKEMIERIERYDGKTQYELSFLTSLRKYIQIITQDWPSESDAIKSYLCGLWNYEYPKQGCLPSCYTWVRKTVTLSQIVCDKPHSKLSQKKVNSFIELINSDISLPPLVCLNGELLDGFHRYQAYKKCGRNDGVDIYINSEYAT
jgi:hypothetical protein